MQASVAAHELSTAFPQELQQHRTRQPRSHQRHCCRAQPRPGTSEWPHRRPAAGAYFTPASLAFCPAQPCFLCKRTSHCVRLPSCQSVVLLQLNARTAMSEVVAAVVVTGSEHKLLALPQCMHSSRNRICCDDRGACTMLLFRVAVAAYTVAAWGCSFFVAQNCQRCCAERKAELCGNTLW